ncbi:MAG: NIPSNAP family containing protein [Methylobacterium sp.]|nr:NIPSNAP family containing protein [Methylobacterium sp.]
MIEQLRIYEIFENNKDAFHARFRDHAARIMKTHGFDIAAMWEAKTKDRTEFIYVLRWPDEATMRQSWARFMQDAEWSAIKDSSAAEHGRMVGAIEERVMQRTSYSP